MTKLIKHIAIIPDGNRRWAKQKGKLFFEGHKYAADVTIPGLYDTIINMKISYCTIWAMSPENYTKRGKHEVQSLLKLLQLFIKNKMGEMNEKGIRLNIIGDTDKFPEKIQKDIIKSMEDTKNNKKLVLTFALNYGGRDEIVRAINKVISKKEKVKKLEFEDFHRFLDTKDMPDPDLIIRTGGEKRTSGFMLWQSEYSEYAFLDKFFPDFTPLDLESCVNDFYNRQRRFGK